MIKVGTKAFNALPVERKIKILVARGYREAAFASKTNRNAFIRLWLNAQEGTKSYTKWAPSTFISTGPTVEHPAVRSRAYFVRMIK